MATPKQEPHSLIERIRIHRLSATFALLTLLSVGILAGSVFTRSVSGKEMAVDSSDARPLTIPSPVNLSTDFTKIAKEVGPAVVNINTESYPKQTAGNNSPRFYQFGPTPQNPNGPDQNGQGDQNDQNDMQNFFNRFFGGQGGNGGGNGGGGGGDDGSNSSGVREALGSGFIVDSRGYIITNNHVVDKADKIYVKLSTDPQNDSDPGRPAHVVGVDPDTDIAVIKIDAPYPLPTVTMGNSDGTQVGDWVIAIGSPFGLSKTVSAGIISAKDRTIDDSGPDGTSSEFQRFIQTDAAINPGNSGGPLVNMDGQVIGMNTAIYTQSEGSEGIGFAMPSDTIINVYNQLIGPEHKVVRGSIGISFQSAESPAVSRMYGFSSGGVMVNTVTPDGPAARGGVKPGDVIVSLDGKPVKTGDQLVAYIASRPVGSTVQMGILRNGRSMTLTVGIADRAKLFANVAENGANSATQPGADTGETKLGIVVSDIPAQLASKLGIQGGVIIDSVRPGSFADEIGQDILTKGAVIIEINKKPVTNMADYTAIVNGLKSGQDVVFVVRGSSPDSAAGNTYVGGTLP